MKKANTMRAAWILLAILAMPVMATAQTWVLNPGNGYHYAVTATMSHAEAQAQAESWGGWLTTVRSAAENAWLVANMIPAAGNATCWFGANDLQTEGVWRWDQDGAVFWNGAATGTLVPGMYANWNGGEPNNSGGDENLGEFQASGGWNDNADGDHPGIVESLGITGPFGTTIEEGTSYTMYVILRWPSGTETFKWFKDGVEMPGLTSRTYTIASATMADQAMYHCEVTSGAVTVTTADSQLRVLPAGSMPAMGLLGLGLLMGLCALLGANIIRRRIQ